MATKKRLTLPSWQAGPSLRETLVQPRYQVEAKMALLHET